MKKFVQKINQIKNRNYDASLDNNNCDSCDGCRWNL